MDPRLRGDDKYDNIMKEFLITNAATIGTLLFFSIFCYVIYFVFKKSNKKKFDESAQIPFHDKDR
jgi:cbb3-type cytochrome oxidase subunit 3